jgi:hypothetical protein
LTALLDTKDEKHILDCFDDDWKFYTLSAQTTPEKTTELNEVAIIRTKKSGTEADRTIFNFFRQPKIRVLF